MALRRRSGERFTANIWPGFVDAMTALLLVMIFVLSIFMVMQFVLKEQITGKDRELDRLSSDLTQLSDVLAIERDRSARLDEEVSRLNIEVDASADEIRRYAALVAALGEERDGLNARISALEEANARELSEKEALNVALAEMRNEVDAQEEAARLAAARREALEALIEQTKAEAAAKQAELEAELEATSIELTETTEALSAEEAARLAEAAAVQALRERLADADAELTALTLSLEEKRREAEETLTLLAAAEASRDELSGLLDLELTENEREAALLAQAKNQLADVSETSAKAQREVALLNQQVTELRQRIGSLQSQLNLADERDRDANIQIADLGRQLNSALAREAERLAKEKEELEGFRSEFFGRMREILGDREDIKIVGDRFLFQSEVLFASGSADLGPEGRAELSKLASAVREVQDEIPEGIDWILRVDGHTDSVPLNSPRFADNWELSQARALSVVRFLVRDEGISPKRLAATGFGEFQPIDGRPTPEAFARNRRIEIKFTER